MAIEELRDRVAVVTGAASGLGLALAERFAAEGMRLVLADVETEALDAVVGRLVGDGVAAIGVPTDVTDATAVDALARAAVDEFGTAHVVCNNAGVGGHHYPTWEAPLAYWEWVVSVSLWGVIHGVRSFLPILVAQNEGHVVNTASVGGLIPVPYSAPYAAAKHAVVGLSGSLRGELAAMDSAVRVSVLCPGAMATGFTTSDRNWPSSLGAPPPEAVDPTARTAHAYIVDNVNAGGSASPVADRVVDAIHSDRFMILAESDAPTVRAAFESAMGGGAVQPAASPQR
jgi:NAD(P)-dependent dehydrogenase (short-subunit alcohol dehydrogenase family)